MFCRFLQEHKRTNTNFGDGKQTKISKGKDKRLQKKRKDKEGEEKKFLSNF